MGAGASVMSERMEKTRALKVGARYGFTDSQFELLKREEDNTISVKQLIDAVKKHDDLQRFDTNNDGVIEGAELTDLMRAVTGNLREQLSGGGGNAKAAAAAAAAAAAGEPVPSVKSAIAGNIRSGDYLQYYQPLTELGSGMSGTVFSVRHNQSGAKYACKSVRKRGMSADDLQKLRDEVKLLSHLDHPNIVKIVDAFEDKNSVTIIMELCNGGELYDSLITAEFYTENVAREIFRQIVHAITYCHDQQVCHRDLKLENFVFDERQTIATGTETLKLIDFGLSRRYANLQRMSTVVGTPYYIAPEIIRGQPYGLQCDVWSLGVILFMLLTGIPPVTGDTDPELLNNVAKGNLSLVNQWTPDWNEMADAFDLITKMLTMDPNQRITSKGIMNHPWMGKRNLHTAPTLDLHLVEGMRRYAGMDPLQRIVSKIVAITLNTKEIEGLRKQFIAVDTDNSGIVSLEEFTRAMNSTIHESKEIQTLFRKMDMDNTGTISYTEFISACLTQTSAFTQERLLEAFDRLDPDRSGHIEQKELVNLLKGLISEGEAMELIRSADLADSDGRVSKAEFMSTMNILWSESSSPKKTGRSGSDAGGPAVHDEGEEEDVEPLAAKRGPVVASW